MAPKRGSAAPKTQAPKSPKKGQVAQSPAKKAKTAAPEAREAPLLALLASIDDIPKTCRDMLQVSLPHCLGVAEEDRHHFQKQVLDSVAGLMADIEAKKRTAITEAQAQLASIQAEKDSLTTELEAQTTATASKKAECDEKSKSVDAASEVVKSAKETLAVAQKAEETFEGKKSGLLAEKDSFAKLLEEVFKPLKECTITKWQTRNKLIAELQKQTESIGLEGSLGDALVATLKLKPEQREGTFAKTALQYAESSFTKHTDKIAQDIAGLDAEAAGHKDAIAAAEAAIAEKTSELQKVEKEWDDIQNEWVTLENACAEVTRKLTATDLKASEATAEVDSSQKMLTDFLELPELFAKLKEPPVPEPDPVPEESTPGKAAVTSGSSYYETVDGMSCDREIIDACRTAVAGCGDGRVSVEDAKKVFVKVADGGRETAVERWTMRFCMQEFKWTEAAHDWIVEELKKVPQEGTEADEPAAKKPKTDGGGYYEVIDGFKCDRGIVDACREAMGGQGDGRVSKEDAEKVWAKAMDAGKVTDAEKWTLRYCLSSFNWTRAAHDWLLEQLHEYASQAA